MNGITTGKVARKLSSASDARTAQATAAIFAASIPVVPEAKPKPIPPTARQI
jgi:hypothetical protein